VVFRTLHCDKLVITLLRLLKLNLTKFTWLNAAACIILAPKVDAATSDLTTAHMILTNNLCALVFKINCGLTHMQQLFEVLHLANQVNTVICFQEKFNSSL